MMKREVEILSQKFALSGDVIANESKEGSHLDSQA